MVFLCFQGLKHGKIGQRWISFEWNETGSGLSFNVPYRIYVEN